MVDLTSCGKGNKHCMALDRGNRRHPHTHCCIRTLPGEQTLMMYLLLCCKQFNLETDFLGDIIHDHGTRVLGLGTPGLAQHPFLSYSCGTSLPLLANAFLEAEPALPPRRCSHRSSHPSGGLRTDWGQELLWHQRRSAGEQIPSTPLLSSWHTARLLVLTPP